MSEIITYPLPAGANYVIPDIGDENWGQNVTDFLVAIPSGTVPTSGNFALTGDVTFTGGFGLVGPYFKTSVINPSSAGFLRLAKTDELAWRNNANSADLPLAIDGSDRLTFNGTPVVSTTGNLTDAGTDGIVVTGGTGCLISSASLAQHMADSTHNGYLSSADWSTFNGKQPAGSYLTALTGDVTAAGPGSSAATLATVNSNVGSFTNSNITVNAKGLVTAASSGTSITLPLTVPNGGTGGTSFTAYSVICGGTTSTNPLQNVSGVGTVGQLLQSNGAGALPTWATIATGSGTVSGGTANEFAYYAASNNVVSASGVDRTNPSFNTVAVTAASQQIQITPGAHTINLSASSPAADRIYTLPDRGANDTFAFIGGGAQTFTGAITSSGGITMSGATIAMGANKITGLANGTTSTDAAAFGQIKYVSAPLQSTKETAFSTTSSTYQATGLSQAITPSSASNRVKITVTVGVRIADASATAAIITLKRGSTDIGAASGEGFVYFRPINSAVATIGPASFTYIDSPATTSATTYEVYLKNEDNVSTVQIQAATDKGVIIVEEVV